MIKNRLSRFLNDTSGAVTVDWVVLTAAVVGLAAASIGAVQTSTDGLADNVGTYINDQDFF